jgi:sugar lactone lactonase YvrE
MRKPIIYCGLGALVIIALWLGIRYWTTGRIVVTTNSNANSIALFKLNDVSQQNPIATSSSKVLDTRLGSGNYVVRVNSKSFATTKVVTVTARKTVIYALNPVSLSALEPVSPSGAYSIAGSNSSLLYVDSGSKTLYEVDSQNDVQPVDTTHKFNSIKWVDTSYGVGEATDGQLYSISNGLIQPIHLPFSTADNKAVSYTVSATKQIFVSHGTDVYSGTDAGIFAKIYTTASPTPSLVSWGDKVAILEVPGDTTNTSLAPSVTIVDKGGRVLAKKVLDADSAAWSQDGKYLALFSDSANSEIVNDSLGTVANLPSTAVNSLV